MVVTLEPSSGFVWLSNGASTVLPQPAPSSRDDQGPRPSIVSRCKSVNYHMQSLATMLSQWETSPARSNRLLRRNRVLAKPKQ